MTYKFLLEYLNFVINTMGVQRNVVFILELDYNSYHVLMSDLNKMMPTSHRCELEKLNTSYGEVEIKVLHTPILHHKLTIK